MNQDKVVEVMHEVAKSDKEVKNPARYCWKKHSSHQTYESAKLERDDLTDKVQGPVKIRIRRRPGDTYTVVIGELVKKG
jgi:hypothetical protein